MRFQHAPAMSAVSIIIKLYIRTGAAAGEASQENTRGKQVAGEASRRTHCGRSLAVRAWTAGSLLAACPEHVRRPLDHLEPILREEARVARAAVVRAAAGFPLPVEVEKRKKNKELGYPSFGT